MPTGAQRVTGAHRENAILMAAVSVAAGSASPHEAAPPPDVDWSAVVALARIHGVLPQLHAAVGAGLPAPASVRERLSQLFRENAQGNLLRTAALIDLLDALESQGVRAMPLKGPALAVTAYGSLAMRQFSDLDLLVPPRDARTAGEILRSHGYEPRAEDRTSIVYVRDEGACRTAIDLQWALAEDRYAFPLTADALWSRAERVLLLERSIWQPACDDQLIVLCAHPAKHCWSRLGWVCDVAAFVRARNGHVNWDGVMERAARLGARRLVTVAMALAQDICGIALPAPVAAALHDDVVARRLVSEIEANFRSASASSRLNGPYGLVEAGLFYARTRERLADKLPYARFLAALGWSWCSLRPNDNDRAVINLPNRLSFLYYGVRPVRLIGKYGGRLFRYAAGTIASLR